MKDFVLLIVVLDVYKRQVPDRIKDKVKEVLVDLDCPELAE